MKGKGCLSGIGLLIGIGAIVVILGIWIFSSYNSLIEKEETVAEKWSYVESAYQRRSDLIPNLVNTVKGYADFEKSTLTAVIEARASATQMKVDPKNLTPEVLAKFQQNQDGLGAALGRLLVAVERYPDLKANQNFLQLQNQLEGTENRIKIERDNFNKVVADYNKAVKKFPGKVIASIFGFEEKGYFKSEAGAEKAPEVKF